MRRARMVESGGISEYEPARNEAGMLLGVLQWHGADGRVSRIPVFQAVRKNQVMIRGMKRAHGWDFVLGQLRKKLAELTR